MCDTAMSPANFRGAESRRKDILLELSVAFLAWLGPDPTDLPVSGRSLLSHKTPPASPACGGAL